MAIFIPDQRKKEQRIKMNDSVYRALKERKFKMLFYIFHGFHFTFCVPGKSGLAFFFCSHFHLSLCLGQYCYVSTSASSVSTLVWAHSPSGGMVVCLTKRQVLLRWLIYLCCVSKACLWLDTQGPLHRNQLCSALSAQRHLGLAWLLCMFQLQLGLLRQEKDYLS